MKKTADGRISLFTAGDGRMRGKRKTAALLLILLLLLAGCTPQTGILPAVTPGPGQSASPSTPTGSGPVPPPQTSQGPIYETPAVNSEIIFKDPYLEEVVRQLIGKSLGSVYVSDVAQITTLTARVKGIRNIEDLRYFTALEELDLYGNKISDISPLAALTKLRKLNISNNYVGLFDKTGGNGMNLQALSSLVLLEWLEANENGITDIGPLAGLVNLQYLSLTGNTVTSVEALSRLTQLRTLYAGKNRITDISPLAGLVNLETLSLESNSYFAENNTGEYAYESLPDIAAVENLKALRWLNVSYNIITSVAPAASLPNLEYLNAASNNITDMECLRGSSVKRLNLEYNAIARFDAILEMTALEELWYQGNPIADPRVIDIFLFRLNNPGQPLPPELEEYFTETTEGGDETEDGDETGGENGETTGGINGADPENPSALGGTGGRLPINKNTGNADGR